MFTTIQNAELSKPLNRSNVREREQGGRKVAYIEGWHAIAEANKIFGFGNWSRETIETKCVAEREREIGRDKNKGWSVTYTAKVRVTMGDLVREGCGAGHGIDRDLGQAHESALKEAETDAMKRALMTFGNRFGLALYDKQQANVSDESESKSLFLESSRKKIATFTSVQEMTEWWGSDEQKNARRDFGLTQEDVEALKGDLTTQKATIEGKKAA